MTTDNDWGELTPENLEDWALEELGNVGELSWKAETPWGKTYEIHEWSYGDGHEMGFVFELAGKIFAATGTYSSWDGSDYNSLVEVEPVEVKALKFKNVKTGKFISSELLEVKDAG